MGKVKHHSNAHAKSPDKPTSPDDNWNIFLLYKVCSFTHQSPSLLTSFGSKPSQILSDWLTSHPTWPETWQVVNWSHRRKETDMIAHPLIKDMLNHIKLPSQVISYIMKGYSKPSATIKTKEWTTRPINIIRGVFQGDTLSPLIFPTPPSVPTQLYHNLKFHVDPLCTKSKLVQFVQLDGPKCANRQGLSVETFLSWVCGWNTNLKTVRSYLANIPTRCSSHPFLPWGWL